jgi:hypothetical protein
MGIVYRYGESESRDRPRGVGCRRPLANASPCLPMPVVSDDPRWTEPRNRVLQTPWGKRLLEHHDEPLTDRRLDLAIGASSGTQKTRGDYCTIYCTIPTRAESSRESLALSSI